MSGKILFKGVPHVCRVGRSTPWSYARVAGKPSLGELFELLDKDFHFVVQPAQELWPGEEGEVTEVAIVHACAETTVRELERKPDLREEYFKIWRRAGRWGVEEQSHNMVHNVVLPNGDIPRVLLFQPQRNMIGFDTSGLLREALGPCQAVLNAKFEDKIVTFPASNVSVTTEPSLEYSTFIRITDGKELLMLIHDLGSYDPDHSHLHSGPALKEMVKVVQRFNREKERAKQNLAEVTELFLSAITGGKPND